MVGKKLNVLVAGATGLVGNELLLKLIESPMIGKVTALVRSPLPISHPKLHSLQVDYDSLSEKDLPANTDAVFCCLGTTRAKAGSREAFKLVDYDYVVKLAVFSQRRRVKQFHVISAQGANPSSFWFYNKVKGKMEQEVSKLKKIDSIYIYRPGLLLGKRSEFRLGEFFGKVLMKVFSFALPANLKPVRATQVAETMLRNALNPKKGVTIVENREMLASPA